MLKIDIVSGFLGAGKTTFIKRLLKTKLSNEKVVLIENEFGEVNVDSDFLSDAKIDIAELSQGCICCSLVGDFASSLNDVITKYNPDRIIVEPSGVGKLSDVKKAVAEANLKEYLNTFVCLVDVTKARLYAKNFKEFFADQIENAKTVVLSRCDVASEEKINESLDVIKKINPNCNIITTSINELSDDVLLRAYEGVKNDIFSELDEELHHHEDCCCGHHHHEGECHHHHHEHGEECGCGHHHEHSENCECGHHHHEGECNHHHHEHGEECGCGHHHADEVFKSIGLETAKVYDLSTLKETLHKLAYTKEFGEVIRAKGIVNTTCGWIQFNITYQELVIENSNPIIIGKICVIGTNVLEEEIKKLF